MKIYVDQKVIVWKRLTFHVNDDINMEDVLKELRECSYIEEFAEGPHCNGIYDCEYLADTEDLCEYEDVNTEVFDNNNNMLDSWKIDYE